VTRLRLLALGLACALPVALPAAAPADTFVLDVEEQAITVSTFSWGVAKSGKVANFSDVNITRNADAFSPRLLELVASGAAIPNATLSGFRPDGELYLRYCFTGVRFTSLQTSGRTGGSGVPDESVSFSYGTIVERFSPQNPDGSLGTPVFGGWDVIRNIQFRANC
jgi:type VI secretion system secreted protein Hcp